MVVTTTSPLRGSGVDGFRTTPGSTFGRRLGLYIISALRASEEVIDYSKGEL